MKLVIFGATGKTGTELVKQALEKGYHVTAFVRDPTRLSLLHDRLTLTTGDVFDPASVSNAVQGQDAVFCALGSNDLKETTVRATGTTHIIQAMKQHGVQRLLVVTAMGTGESWDSLSMVNKFFYATFLKSSREDHEAQETAVKESGLDWTIIRPSGLTDKPRTGVYEIGENILAKKSTIARADVASFLINELEQSALIQKAVTITN